MILALNLNSLMKRLVLGKGKEHKRMKAIRYWLINLPGWVRERSRRLHLVVSAEHARLLWDLRRRISMLLPVPGG